MTVMHDLNAYLTERLTLAAREILEVVGNTILKYQEETSRMLRENEELRQRLREIGAQNNLMLDSAHHVAPPVSSGAAPQGRQPHEQQCNSGLEEDREPQQTDIKQEFPEQHESKPEQGVVDLNKQASALTCTENPSELRILQTSLPFEEKNEEVGCLPHMLPDQIKSELDELDYSIQEHPIFSQPLNRINNGSNTAESENLVDMNLMESGGVMPGLNEQDSGREVCDIPVAGGSKHVPCTLRAEKEDDKPTIASKAAQVLKQNTVIRIMETVDDAIAAYIRSVLPSVISQQSLVGTLKDLGVETLEDLKYVQEADLSDVLRPTEARMLISRFKVWSDESANSEATKDNFASGTSNPSPVRFSPSCQAVNAGNVVDSASSSYADTPSSKSSLCSTQSSKSHEDHDWHHDFAIPWSNMPSAVKTKLEKQERPSARERREIVRLIVDEILSVCKKPRKKHLAEVARRMVLKYPKSFKDIVARQTIGSGYDSLTKQFQCRVDNLKREGVTFQQKRPQRESLETDEGDEPKTKKIARDSYGCINWLPCSLPASETSETQKQKQQQLVNMHKEKEKDQNKIEKIMNATFCTQRKDIITGTDTSELMKMWPYLFEMCGAKAHFLKLTGVSLNSDFDVAMTKKCRRIQDYFQSLPRDRRNKITKILCDIKEASTSCAIAGTVQILLAYFNEAEDKIIVKVEDTCLPREVTDEQLPTRLCIVVCGNY